MEKSIYMASALLAVANAVAAQTDSAWQPPAPRNTGAYLRCDEKAHGRWNQGVCKEALRNLKATRRAITFVSLKAEMERIASEDAKRFELLDRMEREQCGRKP